jgi:hypothetical protein
LYNTLRIGVDPTCWELGEEIEQLPTSGVPIVLPVSHPFKGNLVLSPRSVGSAVFLEDLSYSGTHPNGILNPEQVLYLPSATGPDVHSNPPNFYTLPSAVDLAALQVDIIAAMTGGTFLTVNLTAGVVVIDGATVAFAVLCPPRP